MEPSAPLNDQRSTIDDQRPSSSTLNPQRSTHRFLPLLWYAALALIATQPLVWHLGDSLPLAGKPPATVPLFNLWTMWWNADRATHGFANYWQAPIFDPVDSAFAFSEPQPTLLIVAPVLWLTGNRVLAYNGYLLLALALNGWAAHGLVRSRGGRLATCLLGGTLVEILPWVFWQLDCLQLIPLCGVIWTARYAFELLERPAWSAAWRLGLAHGLTYWLCNYYGLFQTIVLGMAGVCLIQRSLLSWKTWALLLAAGGISAAMVLPLAITQRAVMKGQTTFVRDRQSIVGLSAQARDYTDPPGRRLLPAFTAPDPWRHSVEWRMGPGNLRLIVAGLGLLAGLCAADRRRYVLYWAAIGLAGFALSLGPDNLFWGKSPYDFLREHVPGLAQIRSPFRFAMFVNLAVMVLVVEAIQWLHPRSREVARSSWRRGAAWVPVVVVGGVVLCDVLPVRQTLWTAPAGELPAWVVWLRDQAGPGAVLSLPTAPGTTVDDYEETTVAMYWQTWHRRPLVNGYSGFFPERDLQLRNNLRRFPHRETIPVVTRSGARYVLIPRDMAPSAWILQQPGAFLRWILQFSDEAGGIDIYEIAPLDALPADDEIPADEP